MITAIKVSIMTTRAKYRVILSSAFCLAIFSGQLRADLVAYYPLNGGATATIGSNGTLMGDVSAAADRFGVAGGALYFDGSGDCVQVSTLDDSSAAFSLSAWGRLDDLSADYALASNKSTSTVRQFELWMDKRDGVGGYNVDVYKKPPAGSIRSGLASDNAAAGVWQHVLFTCDGSTAQMFVNGKLVSSGTNADGSVQTGVNQLYIGAEHSNGSYNKYFKGSIDDVGIFDEAISSVEVALIHGLSVLSHVDLNDSKISEIASLSVVGQTVSGVGSNQDVWQYVDGLTGETGDVGDGYIILNGATGEGVALVPEPSSAVMMMFVGVYALLVLRRRLCGRRFPMSGGE